MKKSQSKIKNIAIVLPQFHPFPENDKWWGKGFTEWTNVTKAKPAFKGHYQPHLSSDLGYYDLRLPEAMEDQANLAREYGIDGFCYYHYWFNGKRLMRQPLDNLINTGKPDFPFMLCWANENWTRRWDGLESEILIKQEYNAEDDVQHIRFLCDFYFSDSRYIRVDGKPFILIYRPLLFPNIRATLEVWRNEALQRGIGELYIGYMQTFSFKDAPEKYGFDCAVGFQPDFSDLPRHEMPSFLDKVKNKLKIASSVHYSNTIVSYSKYVDRMLKKFPSQHNIYPSIFPGWDNSARRQNNAIIFVDSTPSEFERWLKSIKAQYSNKDTILFLNAWNEWAEGNHLEPCQKWGRQYLEVVKKVMKDDGKESVWQKIKS
ncbi:MAG: glycoside hydrolase family 99-like domain-containing protein [Chitinophagaceae bacterium]